MKKAISLLLTTILIFTMATVSSETVAFGSTKPDVAGKAAMVYCATTDEVLYAKKPDERMYVASIMKLVTAMLTVEKLGLDTEVVVDEEATNIVPFNLPVYAGEKVTSGDLLHASLMQSSNDATEALGIAMAGSQEAFTDMMRDKVKRLGCINTSPVFASGVDDKNEFSTARDVITIAKAAFSDETIVKVAQTTSYEFPDFEGKEKRVLSNGNPFIKGGVAMVNGEVVKDMEYEGVFAGKTGTNSNGDASMVVGYKLDGLELYVVTLQSTKEERYQDIKKLLDYGVASVPREMAVENGQDLGAADVWLGKTNTVGMIAAEESTVVLPKGISKELISTELVVDDRIEAPLVKGDILGKVHIYVAGEEVDAVDILAAEDVEKGWILARFRITNTQTIIILAVAALLLVLFVFILILRFINKAKRRKIRRKKLKRIAAEQLERERESQRRNWKI